MTYPQGFYWEPPGFPSFAVPYGKTSDFFFSGSQIKINLSSISILNEFRTCWILEYLHLRMVYAKNI